AGAGAHAVEPAAAGVDVVDQRAERRITDVDRVVRDRGAGLADRRQRGADLAIAERARDRLLDLRRRELLREQRLADRGRVAGQRGIFVAGQRRATDELDRAAEPARG